MDTNRLLMGKILPQAIELEISVLGAILIDSNAITEVVNILKPEHFYSDANAVIYRVVSEMDKKWQKIDFLTIIEELRKRGLIEQIGGIHYLNEIINQIGSASNILEHALIIVEKSMLRETINLSHQIIQKCYQQDDAFDIVDVFMKGIDNILSFADNKNTRHISEVLNEVVVNRLKPKEEGIITQFQGINRIIENLEPGQFIILGARPGMGKSALILQVASQIATDKNVLFFTLEMSSEEVIKRLEMQMSELPKYQINNLSDIENQNKLEKSHLKIKDLKLKLDDTGGLDVNKIRLKCQRAKTKKELDLVIIDYLQLLTPTIKGNRENEVGDISRKLKALAMELKVPIIALAQLSRTVESRNNKRPQLSDLRDSGSIEQDANKVLFLYRDKYYNPNCESDIVEVIVNKNREGGLGVENLEFIPDIVKFRDTDKKICTNDLSNDLDF